MNKTPFHPLRSSVLLVCASAISLATSSAEVLVDWGGNYVSATQAYSNTPGDENGFRSVSLSGQDYATVRGPNLWYNGTFANLTPASGYTAPLGKSSTFYGGWSASSGTGPMVPGGVSGLEGGSRSVLNNNPPPNGEPGGDAIFLYASAPQPQFRGLVVFDKADFLNDMSAATVGFDETSSLTFTGFVGGFRANMRWVIQDSGTWYVSDATFTSTADFGFWGAQVTSTLLDPNNQLWASYTPILSDSAGPYLYNPAPVTGYEAQGFSNIQAVGIYYDNYGTTNSPEGSSFASFGLQNFSVNGIAVPEPGTFALAGMALVGIALLRRRKA